MESDTEYVSELPPGLESLPDGWKVQPLGELVSEGRGISYGVVQPGSHDERGVPIVRVNNIVAGRLTPVDALRIRPEIEEKYRRTRLAGGEVLLTLVGAYFGESTVVPPEFAGWNVARAVAVIPVMGGVDPYWICTCLRSPLVKHYMQTRATTTAQPTLNLGDVTRLPILLPPREEQEAIVSVLQTLDDKIELNRRMNETLEALAQGLFKSWFVDATRDGLPQGWRESTVGAELTTLLGGTPSRSNATYWKGGTIPWINSGKANEFRIVEPSEFITKAGFENSSTKLLPERTTIIAITGATLGQRACSKSKRVPTNRWLECSVRILFQTSSFTFG
jgi:type I restriction enzyme, S subunit